MPTDWLVSTTFQAMSSDGRRTAVTARFAALVQRDGNWWCRHESYVAAGGRLEQEDGDAFRIEMHFPPVTWP
jgi:hypothetical protein